MLSKKFFGIGFLLFFVFLTAFVQPVFAKSFIHNFRLTDIKVVEDSQHYIVKLFFRHDYPTPESGKYTDDPWDFIFAFAWGPTAGEENLIGYDFSRLYLTLGCSQHPETIDEINSYTCSVLEDKTAISAYLTPDGNCFDDNSAGQPNVESAGGFVVSQDDIPMLDFNDEKSGDFLLNIYFNKDHTDWSEFESKILNGIYVVMNGDTNGGTYGGDDRLKFIWDEDKEHVNHTWYFSEIDGMCTPYEIAKGDASSLEKLVDSMTSWWGSCDDWDLEGMPDPYKGGTLYARILKTADGSCDSRITKSIPDGGGRSLCKPDDCQTYIGHHTAGVGWASYEERLDRGLGINCSGDSDKCYSKKCDDDDDKCIVCDGPIQKEGATGNGLCEQECGSHQDCDEVEPGKGGCNDQCELDCSSLCEELGYKRWKCGTCPEDGSCDDTTCMYNPSNQGAGTSCDPEDCCCFNSVTCGSTFDECESACSPTGCGCTSNCQELLDKVYDKRGAHCTRNWNKDAVVADVNKDKKVDIFDQVTVIGHCDKDEWCLKRLNDLDDSCLEEICIDTGLGEPIISPSSGKTVVRIEKPIKNVPFYILCPFNDKYYDCMKAYWDDTEDETHECVWDDSLDPDGDGIYGWNGTKAIFKCDGLSKGVYTARCRVLTNKECTDLGYECTSNCCSRRTSKTYEVVTRDCCPFVDYSGPPDKVYKGDEFTVTFKYSHTGKDEKGGGIHLHWLKDEAEFVGITSTDPNIETIHGEDGDYGVAECGSYLKPMHDPSTCKITLRAKADDSIDLGYRTWDWSQDTFCEDNDNVEYDFDRDPDSGTCSDKCDPDKFGKPDIYPGHEIRCGSYSERVKVKIPPTTTSTSTTTTTTIEECILTKVRIDTDECKDGICCPGDIIKVKAKVDYPNTCPNTAYLQVDMSDSDCEIVDCIPARSGEPDCDLDCDVDGLSFIVTKESNVRYNGEINLDGIIQPTFDSDCRGKTVLPNDARLYKDDFLCYGAEVQLSSLDDIIGSITFGTADQCEAVITTTTSTIPECTGDNTFDCSKYNDDETNCKAHPCCDWVYDYQTCKKKECKDVDVAYCESCGCSGPTTTTTIEEEFLMWCDNSEIYTDEKNRCYVSGCNEGFWIVKNKEGSPLEKSEVENIPPLEIEFAAKEKGKIWTRAFCTEGNVTRKKEHITTVKKNPLSCPDVCYVGKDCTCEVTGCTDGLLYLMNNESTPLEEEIEEYVSESSFSYSFTAREEGTVKSWIVCYAPDPGFYRERYIEIETYVETTITSTTTTAVEGEFEMSLVSCSESKCRIDIEKNMIDEDEEIIIFVWLKDEDDGTIYYIGEEEIDGRDTGEIKIYIDFNEKLEEDECPDGTDLEILALAYIDGDEDDYENRLDRIKDYAFEC